jgi:beta-exotoxin I transport system ATP-binding protein
VFLSSHELDEAEGVADRVAIIRHGKLVVDDTVEALRRRAPQTIELRFDAPVPAEQFEQLSGVQRVAADGERVVLQVTGELAPLLRAIADHEPLDMVARHADLDELFRAYYREESDDHADRGRAV